MANAYPLKPFRIERIDALCAVMRGYPLAALFSGTAGAAIISLIPMLVHGGTLEELRLVGHLDINNDHAALITPGAPLSFLFQSPNAYASPDLYPDRQLPGWLYVAVKGDCEVEALLDDDALRSALIESTECFGAANQVFTLLGNDERIGRFIGGIVGFRLRITRISGIAKLAQDKGRKDALLARDYLAGLDNAGSIALLDELLEQTL